MEQNTARDGVGRYKIYQNFPTHAVMSLYDERSVANNIDRIVAEAVRISVDAYTADVMT